MPWPPKQRTAIFLEEKRRHGEDAARRLMRKHGYGKKRTVKRVKRHPQND